MFCALKKVAAFHIGPQKSATTWLYFCLLEHPQLQLAVKDSINFFDIFYYKGLDWYHAQFRQDVSRELVMDMSASYLRSPYAPVRIKEYNPDAKIIVSIREPIERAFSHYWHNKKKRDFHYTFLDYSRNYDLFSSWIETGFYAEQIERYLRCFSRENILFQFFEGVSNDPKQYLADTCMFLGIDSEFSSSYSDKRVNVAREQVHSSVKHIEGVSSRLGLGRVYRFAHRKMNSLGLIPKGGREMLSDVPQSTLNDLLEIYEPETRKLERLLDIDLSDWRERYRV